MKCTYISLALASQLRHQISKMRELGNGLLFSVFYAMFGQARTAHASAFLFLFNFLLPLQYSGLVCHILRLDHDSHQPHNTNVKEQQVRLFLSPYLVHTWQCSVLFYLTQYSVLILRRADKTWPKHRTLMLLFLFPSSLAIASFSLLLSIL